VSTTSTAEAQSAWLGPCLANIPAAVAGFLGMSKRGDRYLHTLLIHGARAAARVVERCRDRRSIAINRLKLATVPMWLRLRSHITMLVC
jgi:hypothetical protein